MAPVSKDLLDRTYKGRDSFWSSWGDVDPDVLAPAINPAFRGLPAWPNLRQAYQTVRRGSLTLVATDGLSDPFDDPGRSRDQGFGLEFFALTKDAVPQKSWLLALVTQAAMNAADHGGFRQIIDKNGLVSMQLYDVPVPDEWGNQDGSVGVLLNQQDPATAGVPRSMKLPLGEVLAVNVKLLRPAELALATQKGAAGRLELSRLFQASGEAQRSGLTRRSVV